MISPQKQIRILKYGIYEGIAASITFTLTSTFLSVFALLLGASKTIIGLLVSLPTCLAILSYIPAAYFAEKMNRRKICIICSFMSRFLWIFVGMAPFITTNPIPVILILASFSSLFGAFVSPSWASMMGEAIPEDIRGRYFSRRNWLCILFSLIMGAVAGFILQMFNNIFGFFIIFSIAGITGILSSYFFYRFPSFPITMKDINILHEIRTVFRNHRFRTFLFIYVIWQFGIFLASPFFNVYLVEHLKAEYIWLSAVVFIAGISHLLVERGWGNLSDMFGHRSIVIISAFCISFVPFLWMIIPSPVFIIPLEILSGAGWAGFTLASFNYLLEITSKRKRAIYTSVFWSLTGIPIILAPVIGGFIADNISFPFLHGLRFVFFISWVILIFTSFLFTRHIAKVSEKEKTVSTMYVTQEIIQIGISKLHSRFEILRPRKLISLDSLLSLFGRLRYFKHKEEGK